MSLESNFTISQKADTAIRRAATVVLLVVGVSSAVLSYAGLRHLAVMAGIADSLSFLFPIVVDGMILLGSLSVLRAALARMPTWFGWMLTILGTITSIAGNILSVENADLVSQVIHSVPPVFLCLSLETFIQLLRHRIKNTYEAEDKNPRSVSNPKVVDNYDVPVPVASAPSPVAQDEMANSVPVAAVPVPAADPIPEKRSPVVVQEPVVRAPVVVQEPVVRAPVVRAPVVVQEPVVAVVPVEEAPKDVPAVSKPVESVPVPVTPIPAQRPVSAQPKAVQRPPSATTPESVELYRIILENLGDELTKTQRIAEILKVYPDARISDLREALGDDPTLRIDGSVRRAKELLKNSK